MNHQLDLWIPGVCQCVCVSWAPEIISGCNPLSKFTRKSSLDVLRPHFQRIGRDSADKNRRKLRIFCGGVRGSLASSSAAAAAVWTNVLRVSYANVMPRYLSTPCLVHPSGRGKRAQQNSHSKLKDCNVHQLNPLPQTAPAKFARLTGMVEVELKLKGDAIYSQPSERLVFLILYKCSHLYVHRWVHSSGELLH